MEWNRSNSNGAVAPPHNQQYLLPSTSMGANGQSQLSSMQQHSIMQSSSFNANKEPLMQNLLQAKTNEDFLKVQNAALGRVKSKRSKNMMQSSIHISSYKLAQEAGSVPDNRSAVQNTVGSNYRMSTYVNTVHQTPQQPPSVPVGQQFGGNGYNTTTVQQPLQSSQALQNYQSTVTYTYPQQNTLYNSARSSASVVDVPCQQMASNVQSSTMYSLQNGASGQFISSQKLPVETNISAPLQNYRNSQNVNSLANYRSLAPNVLTHAPQQQMNVPQLQTLPQLDGNANCYTQSQQRQNFQNVFISNSSQVSSAAAANMPPTYGQATNSSPNILNALVNQNFRQNYVAPNIQQPSQTGNPPPIHSSIGDEQSRVREIIASQDRKQDMLKLLLVYRNVRQKYELLNLENNLLRQRLQATTSTENAAAPPPLLSSLQTAPPQANCIMAGQQNVTRALNVQNSTQINSARDFHSQDVGSATNQAVKRYTLSLTENSPVFNQMSKSDNGSLGQNNYSVFDGGQKNVANGSTSALPSMSSETLSTEVYQDATLREFGGQTNSDNQYASNPNSNNGIVLNNGHGLHSLDKPASVTQSLNSACPENRHLSSYTASLTENGQATSLPREAIEASLPLWKTASQSANQSSETRHSQFPVDSPLAAFRLLDEITSGPTNEVSLTIPVHKPDSAIPNSANPQIAIVSPLVQSKEALHEDYHLSKVCMQDSNVASTALNGLINSRESECFNKILQALESLGANTLNIEAPSSKEPPDANRDSLNPSLLSSTEASSHAELDTSSENIEFVDDTLQISGICTLVEGNTFYDSSIAMMFEASDSTAMPHTDTGDDPSKTVDASSILKAPCTSPEAATIAIKSEPVDEVAVDETIKGDLACIKIPCIDKQADQNIVSSPQESCCDLESSAISDQLSELLTEFPYGIKNYMSENLLKNTNAPQGKATGKPVLKISATPEDFEPIERKAIVDVQSEMVPSPSVNLQPEVKMDLEQSVDLGPSVEKLPSEVQQMPEMVLTPDKHVNGGSTPEMDTCSDDGFEILSNSPESDLHITLLDQDEIPKIFPDECKSVDSEKSSETKNDGLQECIKTEQPEMALHTPKKDSIDVTETGTEKNLFCCLFSWLTLTNKNAPKCNCKQLDYSKEAESAKSSNNDSVSILKTEPSAQSFEQTMQGLPKPNHIGLEILQPNDRPPKLDLVDSDNDEIQQPMEKPPKLERMVSGEERVEKSSQNVTPQPETGFKRSTSVERFQSIKGILMKNNPLEHGQSVTPSSGDKELAFRKSKDQSSNKLKSQGSRKSEKLIVKTDFLKQKHPYKEKRKSERKNVANVAQHTLNKDVSHMEFSNSPGKPAKRPKEEKVIQNTSNIRVEQSPDQQADGRSHRQKSSPCGNKSSHSRGARKHKERESHFEKTRKVPTVQEYLERKRELCKKKTEGRTEQSEGLGDERYTAEISGNTPLDLKRPLSPAKTNVTAKENKYSGTSKGYRKDCPQSGEPHEAGHRRRKDLHTAQKRVPENKTQNLDKSSSKNKIYLSPCVNARRASYEGINLAKLQIRHSPDKPKYTKRRQSLDGSLSKHSNSVVKNIDSPKMLEFKLCSEFAHGSPTAEDKAREAMDSKEESVVEDIKVNKEAWYNSIPFKKRKVENVEGPGFHKLPTSAASTPTYKPLEKNATRQPQDSRTTFNVFKQMYHEQRSKSLDLGQGNS